MSEVWFSTAAQSPNEKPHHARTPVLSAMILTQPASLAVLYMPEAQAPRWALGRRGKAKCPKIAHLRLWRLLDHKFQIRTSNRTRDFFYLHTIRQPELCNTTLDDHRRLLHRKHFCVLTRQVTHPRPSVGLFSRLGLSRTLTVAGAALRERLSVEVRKAVSRAPASRADSGVSLNACENERGPPGASFLPPY